jgi:hypothetical protein
VERLIPWRRALVGWGFGPLSGERGDYVNLGALILRLPAGICIGRGEGGHEGVRKPIPLVRVEVFGASSRSSGVKGKGVEREGEERTKRDRRCGVIM